MQGDPGKFLGPLLIAGLQMGAIWVLYRYRD